MTVVDAAALVELTQRLVRVPSVYDPSRDLCEEPAADVVLETMRSFGWRPDVDVVAPGRPNVIAVVEGGGGGGGAVVWGGGGGVGGGGGGWTVEPFGGHISDG